MKNSYIDIIREPDDIKIQTESSPLRYEEAGFANPHDARIGFEIAADPSSKINTLKVILYPSSVPVKQLRLRFDGKLSGILTLMGDSLARTGPTDLVWKAFMPHELYPWYFHAYDGERLNSWGVRCGCNCFAFWQADPSGITLRLDVRNGSGGVVLKEPLVCAELVCREGIEGEAPFKAAHEFCKLMCPTHNPRSDSPIYGFNNWYWAYGGIDEAVVLHEAEYLGRLTSEIKARPFMVIDDGWQINYSNGYNGGPWNRSNERFPDMELTAARIRERGCRPGIWMRPLLTMSHVPSEAVYPGRSTKAGTVLDPSHPFTLDRVSEDISRIAGWGYELIKHDFSTDDLFGRATNLIPDSSLPPHFHDRSLTSAQIVKKLYATIASAAGDSLILGCDTINHLAAGIFALQRVGDDTSGRSFEWTRRHGIHSMMRLPQNGAFFKIDPDCAAFTDRVSKKLNFDYLEAAALSGCAVFASVTPGILSSDEEKRLAAILKAASELSEPAEPLDWHRTSAPAEYLYDGKRFDYDWYSEYKGSRTCITWKE